MVAKCPSDNTQSVDQSSFWGSGALHWDTHRIGWAVAGGCALVTVIISTISVLMHARNYRNRAEQRQILRILYMPPVYAVVSFLSYRFFRSYTYYDIAEACYEAVTLSAFILLLIEYVAATATEHKAEAALMRKEKTKLPLPFCCIRYRPTKPYFMYTLKWCVLQYVVVRPLVSLAGVICEAFNVLCPSGAYSPHFAASYLDAVDFISISIALYALVAFYVLVRHELEGRRPFAKFLSIKLIVMFTYYQYFVFDILKSAGAIKATTYWTPTNIADGLNALCTCVEMIVFSLLMMWAYPAQEYYAPGEKATSIWRPLWDSVNLSDFAVEIFGSLRFFWAYALGKPYTRSPKPDTDGKPRLDFGEAFGLEGYVPPVSHAGAVPGEEQHPLGMRSRNASATAVAGNGYDSGKSYGHAQGPSYDDDVRLAPYRERGSGRSSEDAEQGLSPPGNRH